MLKDCKNEWPHFLLGANLPWINFAKDTIFLLDRVEKQYCLQMDMIKQADCNVIRWWLHTNGAHSPEIRNGKIVALSNRNILVVKRILELARKRQLKVIICLWSFDMLNYQGQDIKAMIDLLENAKATTNYIEVVLLPLLSNIYKNDALEAIEIFNEPEGMTEEYGWTNYKTSVEHIKRTINLIAGSIHRHFPGCKVTSSALNLKTCSFTANSKNIYADSELIKSGGDLDGYLDFYQAHFYPADGPDFSPFNHPFGHWGLDKPLIVSEFPVSILYEEKQFNKFSNPINFLKINGYHGCLVWDESRIFNL